FLGQIRDRLHSRGGSIGPGLLVINSDPKVVASSDAWTASLLNSIDGVVSEGGQFGPEYPGDVWLNNLKFMEKADDLGKAVYQQLCPYANTEAAIPSSYVRYSLAAYLLGKGHHAALKIT